MAGIGPKTPELVVVTDLPDRAADAWCRECNRSFTNWCTENKHSIGYPLVGKQGQMLKRALQEAKIEPDAVFYTNVVRCAGSKPTMSQIRKCRAYLLDELSQLSYEKCRGILLLGETAVRGVLNDGKLNLRNVRLKELESNFSLPGVSTAIRATYHPDDVSDDPAKYWEIVEDLTTSWRVRDQARPVRRVSTTSDPDFRRILASRVVGLDLEWHGDGRIRLVGLSNGHCNAVFSDTSLLGGLKRRR